MIIHNFVDAAVLSTALRGLTQRLQRRGKTLDATEPVILIIAPSSQINVLSSDKIVSL